MPAGERRQYAGAAPATTLSSGISNVATAIPVTAGTGYPDGSVGPFFIVIDRGLATEEKLKCSSRSGNTITASTRGADDTSAFAHSSGAVVEHIWTADDSNLVNQHLADVALDHHTHYLTTGRHDVEARHAFGAGLGAPSAPTASAVGDVAATGTGDDAAREDHVHGREAFGTPGSSAVGDTVSAGAATTVARSDHRHGREAALGAWTAWVPTWDNFTVGNGTLTAAYQQIGRVVHFYLKFIRGSTSGMGTSPTYTLPVATSSRYSSSAIDLIGQVVILDAGTGTFGGASFWASTTTATLAAWTSTGSFIQSSDFTAASPMSWTTSDGFIVQGVYEAAA